MKSFRKGANMRANRVESRKPMRAWVPLAAIAALVLAALLVFTVVPRWAYASEPTDASGDLKAGTSELLAALSDTGQLQASPAPQDADLRADGGAALGAMASGAGDDEPNDTESQAVALPIGRAVMGTFHSAYDVDFYKITLPGSGKMSIDLSVLSSMQGAMWRVDLYDSSRKAIASAARDAGDGAIDLIPAKSLKAGTYYIKVSNPAGFAGWDSTSKYLLIPDVTLSIASATVASIPNKIYTGKAFKPAPAVKLGGKTLVKGTDYTLSYKNNVKVGTATVTVKGMGHYMGAKSVTFKIFGKPSYAGASSMPVSSKATWTLKNCTLKVVSGSAVSVKGNVVTAKKAGVAKLDIYNKLGKQVATKSVSVYKLSGYYIMQSCMKGKSDMCLDMNGASKENGAQMIVWGKNGGLNQQFTFALQSDGSYTVKSVNSGKLLDVNGASKAWGQNVIQWQANGGANQRWRLTVDASNRITFVNVNSGLVFDVNGGKADWGANMIQWGANGGLNQKWKLVSSSTFVYVIAEANDSKYSYNKYGLLTKIESPYDKTTYSYNAKMRLSKFRYVPKSQNMIRNSGGTFSYDAKGRRVKVVSNGSHGSNTYTITYAYDKNGNPATEKQRFTTYNPETAKNTFDAKGRLTKKQYSGSGSSYRYSYDSEGNLASETSSYGNTMRWTNAYENGRLIRRTMTSSSTSHSTAYEYKKISVPKGYVAQVKKQQWALLNPEVSFVFPPYF